MMNRRLIISIFLSLTSLGSLITAYRLAIIPADPKNAILWGFSPARLVLMAGVFFVLFIFSLLLILFIANASFEKRLTLFVDRVLFGNRMRAILLILCAFILIPGILFHLVPAQRLGEAADQVRRLIPIGDLALLLAIQILIGQYVWRGGKFHNERLGQWHTVLKSFLIIVGILFLLWGLIAWTRIGLQPDRSGWYAPGTPILISQVILAAAMAILISFLIEYLKKRIVLKKGFIGANIILCLVLWLTALLLWQAEPMRKASYFAPPPTPPNFEYYPYSDGAEYDGYAQALLIGKGDKMGLIRRPLYAYFLAFLHSVVGQDYDHIISGQIAVLAWIPALVFMLVQLFSNRTAGLLAAILVILRERNAIALTNVIEVSHSKLLLSEMPSMALMLLLTLLLVRWLNDPEKRWGWGVAAGGVLGFLCLIRSQSILLIPVVLVIAGWFHLPNWRGLARGLLLFGLGLMVTIAPWIARSYQLSGRFVIEDTDKYIDLFASGYTFTPLESIQTLPGENRPEHYNRMVRQIVEFIRLHPEEVTQFYTAHFFHNEISKVIYLPLTVKFDDLRSYIDQMGFWKKPLSYLSVGALVFLAFNLAAIALGISSAYRKARVLVSIPIIISLAYSLSVVPARLSSGRFILPVDWITLLFYAIGLVQLGAILVSLFRDGPGSSEADWMLAVRDGHAARPLAQLPVVLPALFLLTLFGLGFAITPKLIPIRYPSLTSGQLIRTHAEEGLVLDNGIFVSQEQLQAFLDQEQGAVILYGRDLYPSFYKEGEYWGDDNAFNLEARKVSRLQFDLIGSQGASVIFPLRSPPASFPQAADVLVVGCRQTRGVRALTIKIGDQVHALTAVPWSGLTCGLPEP